MDTNQTCNHVCTNYNGKEFCSNVQNMPTISNKNMNFDRNIKDNKYNNKNNNHNPCKPFNSPAFSNMGVL
jgi:hypothetical protein